MNWEPVTFHPPGSSPVRGSLAYEKDKVHIKFGYNKKLLELVKATEGRKWNPDKKVWTAKDSWRTAWILSLMKGEYPYKRYDLPLGNFPIPKGYTNLWSHQIKLFNFVLTRKQGVIIADPGTGKTLVAIMIAEHLASEGYISYQPPIGEEPDTWYVGTKSAVTAVSRELTKWRCKVNVKMFTYEGLVSFTNNYRGKAPKLFIIDEASKIKNWNTQRSMAVEHVTTSMREEYGDDCYIVPMTGSPAPKSPVDWWSLAEVTCPGFLLENNPNTLRATLSIIEQRESIAGGTYPHLLAWKDDEKKCAICAKPVGDHDDSDILSSDYHPFKASVNEVERLARRLEGLTMVVLKKDCLDLPEHTRRIIRLKPSLGMIRKAQAIKASNIRAAQKLILLRELSDGFQYVKNEEGEVVGEETFDTPKWGFLDWFLQNYEESGRAVIWAAFTATIDLITKFLVEREWIVIQIDGRGTKISSSELSEAEALSCMDYSDKDFKSLLQTYPKVAVVAHPMTGGMSYTFTGAPAALYFGNDFNGESKQQSMERIHRGGMDPNRGAITYELVVLKEDMLVIENLANKRSLQAITMKDIEDYDFDPNLCEFFDEGEFR